MASSGGPPPLKRVCLKKEELQSLSKEDLIEQWLLQDQYIDSIEIKAGDSENSELVSLRESEEKLKQQQMEASRKENILLLRLTTKEQEMQEYGSQIQELKQSQVPTVAQLRAALLDPAVNLVFEQMRKEVDTLKARLEETQNELSAWKFTPDSNTGKRLMAKCRLLYQENEELGKVISSGRMAKLEGDLALQRNFSEEMKKSQAELDEFLQELDEDVDGMQSTIIFLQQQLRESKEQITKLQNENKQLSLSSLSSTLLDNNDAQHLPQHFQIAHPKINSILVEPSLDVHMTPERPETPPTPVYSEQPNTPEAVKSSEPMSPDLVVPSVVRLQEALSEPRITESVMIEPRSPEPRTNQTSYLTEQPRSPNKIFIPPQSPQPVIEFRASEPLPIYESKIPESLPVEGLRTHELQEYRMETTEVHAFESRMPAETRSPPEQTVFQARTSDLRSYDSRNFEPRTTDPRSFAPHSPEPRTPQSPQNAPPPVTNSPHEIRSPGNPECSIRQPTPPPSVFVLPVSQLSPRIVENSGHIKPETQTHQLEQIHTTAYAEKPSLVHENGIKQGVICYGNQALLNENAVIVKQERIDTSPTTTAKLDSESVDTSALMLKKNIIIKPDVVKVEINDEPLNLMSNSEDGNVPLDLVKKGVIARGYGDGTSNSTIITSHMATNVIARCHSSDIKESESLVLRSTVVKSEPPENVNVTSVTPSPPQSPDPIPAVSGKRTRAYNKEEEERGGSPKRIKGDGEETVARDQALAVHIDEDTEVQVAQTLACWAVASKERLEASKVLDPGTTTMGILGNGDFGGSQTEEGKV